MNIKTIFIVAAALAITATPAFAKKKNKKEGFQFETVIEHPVTSIKNQSNSGTCWAFAAISFFESEIIRNGYNPANLDLSEMFIVSNAYYDKGIKFTRLHGVLNFGAGSSFGDALTVLKTYGMVPDSEMDGLKYGTDMHRHSEMDAVLKAYVNAVIKNPNRTLSTAWKNGYRGILDAYLGEVPQSFEVEGKEYNPKSYMESLGINLDDYVDLTSFTHHPFYEPMVIEVPDNWRWETAYNMPIEDLMRTIDYALENGYTIAWASDVSEAGFTRNGIGIVPDIEKMEETGSDQARWIGKTPAEKNAAALEGPGPELEITQEMRQEAYDNYQTTDDHGMHMYGIAKDQNGKKYYLIKNSWGEAGAYKGIWYVSEAFVKYKTMDILINKNAIPADIREKLGL